MIADPDPDSNPNPEKTRYVVIDEETGQPKTIVENNTNSYQYTFDGPVTYTTESDYYGNLCFVAHMDTVRTRTAAEYKTYL